MSNLSLRKPMLYIKHPYAFLIIIRAWEGVFAETVWEGLPISELAFFSLLLRTVHTLLGSETGGFLEELVEHPLGVEDLLVGKGLGVLDIDGQEPHLGLRDHLGLDPSHDTVGGYETAVLFGHVAEDFLHECAQFCTLDLVVESPFDIELGHFSCHGVTS